MHSSAEFFTSESLELSCPECRGSKLRLDVTLLGRVTFDFSGDDAPAILASDDFTSQIPKAGLCVCQDCDWAGTAADAEVTDLPARAIP